MGVCSEWGEVLFFAREKTDSIVNEAFGRNGL